MTKVERLKNTFVQCTQFLHQMSEDKRSPWPRGHVWDTSNTSIKTNSDPVTWNAGGGAPHE